MIPANLALAFLQYNESRQAVVKLEKCWQEWRTQSLPGLCVQSEMDTLRQKLDTARASLTTTITAVDEYIAVYLLALSAYGTVNSTLQK